MKQNLWRVLRKTTPFLLFPRPSDFRLRSYASSVFPHPVDLEVEFRQHCRLNPTTMREMRPQ